MDYFGKVYSVKVSYYLPTILYIFEPVILRPHHVLTIALLYFAVDMQEGIRRDFKRGFITQDKTA